MEKTSRSISHIDDEHDPNIEGLVNAALARRVFVKQNSTYGTEHLSSMSAIICGGEATNKRFDDMASVKIVDYC